jgi:hypothetical protein
MVRNGERASAKDGIIALVEGLDQAANLLIESGAQERGFGPAQLSRPPVLQKGEHRAHDDYDAQPRPLDPGLPDALHETPMSIAAAVLPSSSRNGVGILIHRLFEAQ